MKQEPRGKKQDISDEGCSSIQWFPTSTFCNRRSSFDISLDLVFRNSYFVFLLGTSYFVPCTVQFVFLYVISYPNNPIPLLPSCQLSIQGSCRKRYNRSGGSLLFVWRPISAVGWNWIRVISRTENLYRLALLGYLVQALLGRVSRIKSSPTSAARR